MGCDSVSLFLGTTGRLFLLVDTEQLTFHPLFSEPEPDEENSKSTKQNYHDTIHCSYP
jgi:hypothetical protein